MKRLATFFFLVALLNGCTEESSLPTPPYAQVRTLQVVNINDDGAQFRGKIVTLPAAVTDHGFIWSSASTPTIEEGDSNISLGPKNQPGDFNATLEHSLSEGVRYYVRAYAIGSGYTVYGDVQEFVSKGTKAPTLTSIDPTTATWGDTITISGTNLSILRQNTTVLFGPAPARVVSLSVDHLKVIVPGTIIEEVCDVLVNSAGSPLMLDDGFRLLPPEIESVTPQPVNIGQNVTVKGKNFNPNFSHVYVNGGAATVVSTTAKQIVFTVPVLNVSGLSTLRIETGNGNLFTTSTLNVNGPVITNVAPLTAPFDAVITITGERFNPANLAVYFGNTYSPEIVSATSTEIKVKVPQDLESATSIIRINTDGINTTFATPFVLTAATISTVTPTRVTTGTVVTITGTNFSIYNSYVFFGGMQGDVVSATNTEIVAVAPQYLYEHSAKIRVYVSGTEIVNSPDYSSPWIRMEDFPGDDPLAGAVVAVDGDYAYIGFAMTTITDQIWVFHQPTKQWTTLPNFPATGRAFPVFFKLNNRLFAGGGGFGLGVSDFYSVDTDGGSDWIQQNDLPFNTDDGVFSFSNGTSGYVLRSSFGAPSELWRYNPTTSNWTQLADAPFAISVSAANFTTSSGWFLVTPQNIRKFNFATETWTDYGSVPADVNGAFAFMHGNDLYVPTGNPFQNPNTATSMVKLNIANGEFTEEPDYMGDYRGDPVVFTINNVTYLINGTFDGGKSCMEFDPSY